jgi:hypothetical protein
MMEIMNSVMTLNFIFKMLVAAWNKFILNQKLTKLMSVPVKLHSNQFRRKEIS